MFEEYTYESMLKEAVSNADEDIDTREGSVFLDCVSPCMLMLAMCFTQAGIMYDQLQLRSATGEALDLKGSERLMDRAAATRAEYRFVYSGEPPDVGATFYSEDGLYFTLLQYDDDTYYLESVDTGTQTNTILKGSKAIPVETYMELKAASFGDLLIPARDEATDEEYRQTIYDNLIPGENGNVQHYKNWCKEADEGVSHARIIPCHAGANTVLGIIIAADGTAASPELLAKVQEYVDPDNDGDGMGDGLGEGVANLGAHFTAEAPQYRVIPITLSSVALKSGYSIQTALSTVQDCIKDYFVELSLKENDTIVINASEVGAKIQALDCMESYQVISLDARDNDILYKCELTNREIPKLGRIDIDGTVSSIT